MPLGLGFMNQLMRQDPAFIHEFLNRNWMVAKKGLDQLLQMGQKIIMCGDDYGYNAGLMLRETQWREFIRPVLEQYVQRVHRGGAKFILHSCGKVESIFKDFYDLGIDGVQSLNPDQNDLEKLLREYGDQICLIGGIDDSQLLFSATPNEVATEVSRQCEQLGKYGRWIPGPTNFLGNQPVPNLQAMISAIRQFSLQNG
jgi:uroporphyrinogen decarboxylase